MQPAHAERFSLGTRTPFARTLTSCVLTHAGMENHVAWAFRARRGNSRELSNAGLAGCFMVRTPRRVRSLTALRQSLWSRRRACFARDWCLASGPENRTTHRVSQLSLRADTRHESLQNVKPRCCRRKSASSFCAHSRACDSVHIVCRRRMRPNAKAARAITAWRVRSSRDSRAAWRRRAAGRAPDRPSRRSARRRSAGARRSHGPSRRRGRSSRRR
jgi:hypothetical protein